MKRAKGFTLVELIMVLAVVAMLILVAVGGVNNTELSYGVNGLSETRCIAGYKHVVGEQGQARQILDENGRGIKCQ